MDSKAASTCADNRVVKRAADGVQAARIAAEADVLAAAQIPGVVEFVAVDHDGEQPCLVTTRVDGPDLGRIHDLSIDEVAGVVAAVATVLADLHDLGLVHGSVMASHVLVGPDGRPVLCGFGYGGRVGETTIADAPLPEGHADPARHPGDPLAPSADVYALGAMLRALAAAAPATAAPGPLLTLGTRRTASRLGRGARTGPVRGLRPTDRSKRDALVAVADRATTVEPRLRLGARALAAAVSAAVPGARLPRRVEADTEVVPAPPEAPPRPALLPGRVPTPALATHRRVVVGAVVAAAVAVAAVAAFVAVRLAASAVPASIGEPPTPPAPAPAMPPEPAVAPTTTAAPGRPAVTAAPNPACPSATAPLAADTDGDGCAEPLRWADGVLEAGDRRWMVGQPGDRVATADWSCSGRSTLALLRPATGEVFVFGQWAQAGHDLVAEAAGRVVGGFAIRAADLGDGCPRVAVERSDGAPVTLPRPPFSSP